MSVTAAAALLAAVRTAFRTGAFAQEAGHEVKKAVLGYIVLTDSSPLIVAKERWLYAKLGMPDVEVAKQAAWAARAKTWCSAAGRAASTARTSSPRCPM